MNILLLTIVKIKDINQRTIYMDLMHEFAKRGHNVYIAASSDRSIGRRFLTQEADRITLIRVQIDDYFEAKKIKKGLSLVTLENKYLEAIEESTQGIRFDLVLYATPPITFSKIIRKYKKEHSAMSYLLLKDIFPQNAIDLGMMRKNGLIHKFFLRKERMLYEVSDYIGCMSKANCDYIIAHNRLDVKKIEVCPNSVRPNSIRSINKGMLKEQLNLPKDEVVFLYGGNIGMPQGLDFIIRCLEENEKDSCGYILIVGQGAKYKDLEKWFVLKEPKHCRLIDYMPREQYEKVVDACDVGLIFLDHKFTIPNFPSRLLAYMQSGLPVLAATDTASDVGEVIENCEMGYWCESDDPKRFKDLMKKFADNEARKRMGRNARSMLEHEYNVSNSYEIIMKHFKNSSRA